MPVSRLIQREDDGDSSTILELAGILSLVGENYRDRETGVAPHVDRTWAAA